MGRGIAYNVGRIACEYASGFRANCAFLGELSLGGEVHHVNGVLPMVIEARNKAQMEIYFSNRKKEIQSKKSAMSVAKNYYQNMNKVRNVTPQFLDRKK